MDAAITSRLIAVAAAALGGGVGLVFVRLGRRTTTDAEPAPTVTRARVPCSFRIDGDQQGWDDERDDLPLYPGDRVAFDGAEYEIIDGPDFEPQWRVSLTRANFVVKPAPTNY